MLKTSEAAYKIIRKYESLRLVAYQCTSNKWTIGWGHTKGVKQGDRITKERAEILLVEDVRECEINLNKYRLPLSQNQYDALVSFTFNIGDKQFSTSTMLKKLKTNVDDPTIAHEFSRWIFSGGVVQNGLIKRRNEESALYFTVGHPLWMR
jgi:lysozyme